MGFGGAGGLECKVQGSRFKSQRLWYVNGLCPGMVARLSVTASPNNKHCPLNTNRFTLTYCIACVSLCFVGCWTSSLLAKGIPHMHVNDISDSNSNSNFITLRAHVALTLCYLCWWSFLPPTSAFTLVAHAVLTL